MFRRKWIATGDVGAGTGIGWALAGSALCHLAAASCLILGTGGLAGVAGSPAVIVDIVSGTEAGDVGQFPRPGDGPPAPADAGRARGIAGNGSAIASSPPRAGAESPAIAAPAEPRVPSAAPEDGESRIPAPSTPPPAGADPAWAAAFGGLEGVGREPATVSAGAAQPGDALPESPARGSGDPVGSASAIPDGGRWGTPAFLRERIRSRIVYPEEAIRRGQEGEVLLRIRIGTGGIPGEIRVARSSGVPLLDEAARRGVVRAAPLPSDPGWIEVPVRFVLR